jgi:hypothetical protein
MLFEFLGNGAPTAATAIAASVQIERRLDFAILSLNLIHSVVEVVEFFLHLERAKEEFIYSVCGRQRSAIVTARCTGKSLREEAPNLLKLISRDE